MEDKLSDLASLELTLIIDGLGSHENDALQVVNSLCLQHGWHFIVSLSDFIANVAVQDPQYADVLFVELQPWGPSRIREFALKLFDDTPTNADLAYKFVVECLRTVDLPATPTIVSLYLSVFPKIGSEISSLSFLRLLEKIELLRLGVDESGTINSLYNRRRILELFAVECLTIEDTYMSQVAAVHLIETYFKPKGLKVEPLDFLSFLINSGYLHIEGDDVGFAQYAFFDYYLALSFKDSLLKDDQFTGNIAKCARVASALSLFAGLERENLALADRVMDTIVKECQATGELRLKDLDGHITGLLISEKRGAAEVAAVASEIMQERVDYEALDDSYEQQRKTIAGTRERLLKQGIDNSADDLVIQIQGLSSFYQIFRNLENIDQEWKVLLLDRILDFHISTNFFLIDFYFGFSESKSFRTFAAYLLTWTGHGFMASTLGNPTMCEAIRVLLDTVTNDFKEFLLLLLLSELQDDTAVGRIDAFVERTKSRAATEILFMHVREKLVSYDGKRIPEELIRLFKEIFIKRQLRFGEASRISDAHTAFDGVLEDVKKRHWNNLRESGFFEKIDPTNIVDV